MKLKKVKLQNFKGWANLEFDFNTDNKTILYGKSGSGKSSILEAFKFVLGLNSKEPYPQIKDKETGGMSFISDLEVVVEFELERNGIKYVLKEWQLKNTRQIKKLAKKNGLVGSKWFWIWWCKMNGTLYKEKSQNLLVLKNTNILNF